MQTFILHTDMDISADRLDIRRRFKQSVECKQIYQSLTGQSKGWTKHPAVLQWADYKESLLAYGWICLRQCTGYKVDRLYNWYLDQIFSLGIYHFPPKFHKLIPFHQGLMVRKDYHYYHDIFPDAISTGWARYLDTEDKVFHIKFGKKIYDPTN